MVRKILLNFSSWIPCSLACWLTPRNDGVNNCGAVYQAAGVAASASLMAALYAFTPAAAPCG